VTLGNVLLVVLFTVVWFAGVLWWSFRRVLRGTPTRVVRGLLQSDGHVEIKVKAAFVGTWNPARPLGANNALSGPGVAVYSLDDTGEVHLDWRPKIGQPQQLHGPLPDKLRPESDWNLRRRQLFHKLVAVYCVALGAGFVVGFAVAGGSLGRKLAGGGIGLFFGILVLAIAGTVLSAVRSFIGPAKPDPH